MAGLIFDIKQKNLATVSSEETGPDESVASDAEYLCKREGMNIDD